MDKYLKFQELIEKYFDIVDKKQQVVPFILNKVQKHFLENMTEKNIILKARQLGISSLLLAILTLRFLFKQNQRCVVVSHEASATQKLLDRVKFFISSVERKLNTKVPLKYNSRSELLNEAVNSSFYIGTAGSKSFGRGDTLTALLLSEFAFYDDPETILSGVFQAVVQDGLVFIETTANGFNFFKTLWDEAEERGFKRHFYNPEWEYDDEFLEAKKKELKRFFDQEYPMSPEIAFLSSGDLYFDRLALEDYLKEIKEPIKDNLIYV